MTLIRLLIALPLLLILVLFALSNQDMVDLHFWPTDFDIPVPLAAAVLIGAALAFFIGAGVVWISLIAARVRARRAESRIRQLEAQIAQLRRDLDVRVPVAGTPAGSALVTARR